jgi:hypothetical protein
MPLFLLFVYAVFLTFLPVQTFKVTLVFGGLCWGLWLLFFSVQ